MDSAPLPAVLPLRFSQSSNQCCSRRGRKWLKLARPARIGYNYAAIAPAVRRAGLVLFRRNEQNKYCERMLG